MKRGAIELSFSMIFAIILIGVFIFVAFYAIKVFLDWQCTVGTGNFLRDLQTETNRIWQTNGAEQNEKEYFIGSNCGKLEYVCFYKYGNAIKGVFAEQGDDFKSNFKQGNNLYFYPIKNAKVPSVEIEHLNIDTINPNPYCEKIENGKVKITLGKSASEDRVRVIV